MAAACCCCCVFSATCGRADLMNSVHRQILGRFAADLPCFQKSEANLRRSAVFSVSVRKYASTAWESGESASTLTRIKIITPYLLFLSIFSRDFCIKYIQELLPMFDTELMTWQLLIPSFLSLGHFPAAWFPIQVF
jgi:hypothetical protein